MASEEDTATGTPTKKRRIEDLDVSSKASVQGIVTKLSPMKQGKKTRYYEGSLSDGKKHIRIIGFSEMQQKELTKFKESAGAVKIVNCEVKKAWGQADKLELVLKQSTDIEDSSEKFEVTLPQRLSLGDIAQTDDFESVTVTAKVVGMEGPMQVSGGIMKQDVYISDANTTIKLTLWENDVEKLVESHSYLFTDVLVRSYSGKKYLSFTKGALMAEVNNVGEVKKAEQFEEGTTLHNCSVIGVDNFEKYYVCLSCKLKVKGSGGCYGTCSSCGMLQVIDQSKSHIAARLMIKSGEVQSLLQVYGKTLLEIAGVDEKELSREALLSVEPFKLTYKNNTIISIARM